MSNAYLSVFVASKERYFRTRRYYRLNVANHPENSSWMLRISWSQLSFRVFLENTFKKGKNTFFNIYKTVVPSVIQNKLFKCHWVVE